MTIVGLRTLVAYHYWANGKLMAVVSQLSPEQFTVDLAGSYGSVRNTLVHTMSAEWGWLWRCGGPERGAALKGEDFPAPAALIEKWTWLEAEMRRFLAGLSEEDLNRPVKFSFGGPEETMSVGHLLQHAMIHSVHHRGQCALLLRALGVTPGNFDFLFFEPAILPMA